jgi:hypothetical protein
MVGHPEVGSGRGGADSFGGRRSDREFESMPGSLSGRANLEGTSEMPAMKSIGSREIKKFQDGSPAWTTFELRLIYRDSRTFGDSM